MYGHASLRKAGCGLLMVLSLALASAGWAAPADDRRVDSLFAAWDKSGSPGAVVAVSRAGKLLYARGYGYADLRFGIHNAPDVVYDVGSVSKQFTAYAVLALVKQGKLKLDDDIRTHLPWLPDYGYRITVRELLQHTSGLRDYFELALLAGLRLDDLYTPDFVDTLLGSQRALNFAPGTASAYTNTEYYLLAKLVEQAAGESFPAVMQRLIFGPLGMGQSRFTWDPRSVTPRLASSYWPDGSGGYLEVSLGPDLPGPSGLRTSALDLLKWEDDFDTHRLDAGVRATMLERAMLADGRVLSEVSSNGIHLGQLRGVSALDADGGIGGFRAAVLHLPAQRLSVVVLSNIIVFDPAGMAEQVAAIYAGLPAAPATPGASGSAKPAAGADIDVHPYLGEYRSGEVDASYDVCTANDHLYIASLRNEPVHLSPAGADGFAGDQWWLQKARFTRDAAGGVDSMVVTGFRAVRELELQRVSGTTHYCHS